MFKIFLCVNKKKEIIVNIFEIFVYWNIVKIINMSFLRIYKI